MQTKAQLQQLLISAGRTPNKAFGQNFLIDLNLMRLLIDTADIQKTDTVLEVGCATGSLTEGLLEKAATVIAVEVDSALYNIAKERLKEKQNVCLLNADILKTKHIINPDVIGAVEKARKKNKGRFLLVANLPYNVASPFMINLITQSPFADAMYVTVQKEVADRMTARLGSKHYGTLSILLSAIGDIKLIRTLKPGCFWPAPMVNSAMISFARSDEKANRIRSIKIFTETVSLFMQHRRKTLKACTKFASGNLVKIQNWQQIFETADVNSKDRPEQISPEDFLSIANLCTEAITSS